MMEIPKIKDFSDYDIGVVVARLQVDELHSQHIKLLDTVCNNHKMVILFLGVSVIENTAKNPIGFAARKMMVQSRFPNIVILPLKDNRSDEVWSKNLDAQISIPFGERKVLLYGSRNSFISSYQGRYDVVELTTDVFVSGSNIRKELARTIGNSPQWRAGVIYANSNRRAVSYPTVDVVAYNEDGQILLGKKPNETKWRCVGGFVDPTDTNYEMSAIREFREETGGEIADLKYVCSQRIDDWRYRSEPDGIMTTLFLGKYTMGRIAPDDDIAELKFFDISELCTNEQVENKIMMEHVELIKTLIYKINSGSLTLKLKS